MVAPTPAPSTSSGGGGGDDDDNAASNVELHALLTAELTQVHAHWADATLVKAVLVSVSYDLGAAEAALADMQVVTGGDAGVAEGAGVANDAVAAAVGLVGGKAIRVSADCHPAGVRCTVERGELEALGDIYGMIRGDAMKATRKWLQTVRKSAAAFAQQVRADGQPV